MHRSYILFAFVLIASSFGIGCGGTPQREIVTNPPPLTPLTVEEWKAMEDLQLKHDPQSHERLQLGDPKLANPAAWTKFEKEVIIPEFRKDFPPAG